MSPRTSTGRRLLALLLTTVVAVAGFAGAATATDPDEVVPSEVVTEVPAPEEEVAEDTAPEGTAPERSAPEGIVPEEVAPTEEVAPEGAATEEAAPAAAATATGAIAGRITVPVGVDVTKVQVSAEWQTPGVGHSAGALVSTDGTYRIEGLESRSYTVRFYGGGSGALTQYWPGVREHDRATQVVVGTGTVTGIDARMEPSVILKGRIITDGVADLTAAHIRVVTVDDVPVFAWDTVNLDGTWTVGDLPTGTYFLEFDGRWAGLPTAWWNTTGDPWARTPVSVVAGQTYSGFNVTLNGPGQRKVVESYVTRIYRHLFDRAPDPSGLATWTAALMAGTPSSAVTNRITASNEYRSGLIRAAYRDYLGRSPEPGGLQTWLAAMSKGMTIRDMRASILASGEAYARAGGTDPAWVTALYRAVLGRAPGGAERDHWVARMRAGASRTAVARGFLLSTEHLAHEVDGYYRHLLGRSLDASGRATWVRAIQRGVRDEEIIARLISSQEYRTNVVRDYFFRS